MKSILAVFLVTLLGFQSVWAADGQSGNGDFVYKDKARLAEALNIIKTGIDELVRKTNKAPDSVFDDLTPPVDRDLFFNRLFDVHVIANDTGFRVVDNKVEILMLDYHCGPNPEADAILGGCIMVYAPMIVALMYMDDKRTAKRFFQTELIHEILHHFGYKERQAEVTAPLLYKRLFKDE